MCSRCGYFVDMGRKTSIVWNHFTIPVLYPKKALCNYCRQLVCRGQANLGTTSLMNHLKRCNEFKANVLGIPRGVSDMMAAAISAADAQLFRKMPQDECSETGDFVTSYESEHLESQGNELAVQTDSHWPSIVPGSSVKSIPVIQRSDDSPSFVGRAVCHAENVADSPSLTQETSEYRNEDRSSVLLYGDISSTSELNEEPSSSTFGDVSILGPSTCVSDLVKYSSSNTQVGFLHGGIVLHFLYQQYQAGKYCDMHIMPQKLSSNEVTISETGKVTKKNNSVSKEEAVISVHSCVLGALSKKVNSFVEMGCSTIHLKKGGSASVKGLMEIVYTGKLEKIRTYSESHLLEILEVARFLEVDLAVQYLMREIPEGKQIRTKSSLEKLIHERIQTLKSANGNLTQSSVPSQKLCRRLPDKNDNGTDKEGNLHDKISEGLARKRKISDISIDKGHGVYTNHEHHEWQMPKKSNVSNCHGKSHTIQNTNSRIRKQAVHEMVTDRDEKSDEDDNGIFEAHDNAMSIKREVLSSSIPELQATTGPLKKVSLQDSNRTAQ